MKFNNIFYNRPAYVPPLPRSSMSTSESSDCCTDSGDSTFRKPPELLSGIPPALTLDKIIDGATCPPCTVVDLMNYCLYVEHSAENLQFYLWLRDYTKRFLAARQYERNLSPEWTAKDQETTMKRVRAELQSLRQAASQAPDAQVFGISDFPSTKDVKSVSGTAEDPFQTPPVTASDQAKTGACWELKTMSSTAMSLDTSTETLTQHLSPAAIASETFAAAGLSGPFTVQPFREEINRIIATYVAENAPRELNLDGTRRNALLIALQKTTHPSAFRAVERVIDDTLRLQVHPNFIRWTISNGNPPRQFFALGLGIALIAVAIVFSLLVTLSALARGWRAFGAVLLVVGVAILNAARKGMCVVLHGLHHRHLRPWELFAGESPTLRLDLSCASKGHEAFDPLATSCNTYEDMTWVVRYRKRNLVRKIFDREVWIQESALRQLQDLIFWQSLAVALVAAGVFVAVFMALPRGNLF